MKKYITITAIAALAFTSCKKTLDVNKDPDNPGIDQATPTLVFPAGVASAAGRIGGDLAILGGIWAQFYTQGTTASQYRDIDAFNVMKSLVPAMVLVLAAKSFESAVSISASRPLYTVKPSSKCGCKFAAPWKASL